MADSNEIFFINNEGEGFSKRIKVPVDLTVEQLFDLKMEDADIKDYNVLVNGQHVAKDEQLDDGDRVSFTPRKIEGALAILAA